MRAERSPSTRSQIREDVVAQLSELLEKVTKVGKVNQIADLVSCSFERAERGKVGIVLLQPKTFPYFPRKPLRAFLDYFSKPYGYLLPYIKS